MIWKPSREIIRPSRRSFLTGAVGGLIAAPAVVRAGSLSLMGAGKPPAGAPPAGITQVQKNGGTSATNANIATSLPSGTTAGNEIFIIATGEGTIATPSGFTSRSPQVNINGFYFFEKLSASGNSTDTPTLVMSGAFNATWLIAEYSGIAAFNVGNGNNAAIMGGHSSWTTAAVTPTAGIRLIIAGMGITGAGPAETFTAGDPQSWTASFVGQQSVQMVGGGAREPLASGWATLSVTADGSTAYSTNGSFTLSNGASTAPASIVVAYS